MNTFLLSDKTATSPVTDLLKGVENGGVEVIDGEGNVIAYVLSPTDRDAWTCAEANLDLDRHRHEIQQALKRRGGVTTEQLLENAAAAVSDKMSES